MQTKILNSNKCLLVGLCATLSAFLSVSAYAADPQIMINDKAENLYVATGTKQSTDGTASYNASTNTLTLNNYNGKNIGVSNLSEINLELQGENTLTPATEGYSFVQGINATGTDLNIIGAGNLKIDRSDLSNSAGDSVISIMANNISIDSATLDISGPTSACLAAKDDWARSRGSGSIVVKSGTLNLACKQGLQAKDVIINGGSTHIDGQSGLSSLLSLIESLTVNSGLLDVKSSHSLDSGMMFTNFVEIRGGEVNVTTNSIDGIIIGTVTGHTEGHFLISGGTLNINGAKKGIVLGSTMTAVTGDAYVEFSGGTTTIKTSGIGAKAVEVVRNNEKNNGNIIFGDTMNFSPADLKVTGPKTHRYTEDWIEHEYYLDYADLIISDKEIAVQPENTPSEDQRPTSDNTEDTDAVKVPNTGSFTGESNGTNPIAISLFTAIPLVVFLIYALPKVHRKKVDFNK